MLKERPRCRKAVEKLLEYYNCTLEELYQLGYAEITDGLKKQTKKMIQESGNPHNLSYRSSDYNYSEKGRMKWQNIKRVAEIKNKR